MMRAGKDYITKDQPEPEDARSVYLRELLLAVNPQPVAEATETEEQPAPKLVNQNKPTLKLTK